MGTDIIILLYFLWEIYCYAKLCFGVYLRYHRKNQMFIRIVLINPKHPVSLSAIELLAYCSKEPRRKKKCLRMWISLIFLRTQIPAAPVICSDYRRKLYVLCG